MKILHFICSPAAGGAETYVRDLSISTRLRGHDVHIVFLQSAAESNRDLIFERDFLNSLSESSISCSFIGLEARRKPWLGIFRLRKIVENIRPDVIHCHLYYAVLFTLLIFKIPIVYTHHNIKLGFPKFFYQLLDLKVGVYIGICGACQRILMGGRRKVVLIYNAVSRNRIPTKRNSEHGRYAGVTCVYVGSLSKQKNLSLMLQAFSSFRHQDARLLIVGEGPDKEKLGRLASSLEIAEQVKFLGNVSNVGQILLESDIFLMSSAWEGLPIALIEAALAGLPVLVTNVGGCSEVVHRCANGFVVDSLEAEDYSFALEKLLADGELRSFFSRNALKFSREFEIENAADKHLELYKEIIK